MCAYEGTTRPFVSIVPDFLKKVRISYLIIPEDTGNQGPAGFLPKDCDRVA